MEELTLEIGIIYIISFFLSILVPDLYIPEILKRFKSKIEVKDEKEEWYFLPKCLGQIERAIYWLFWIFFTSQAVIFIGIWLALKGVGDFSRMWLGAKEEKGEKYRVHKIRAKFNIFLIGNGLSIFSVIVIYVLTQLVIQKVG